MHLRQPLPLVGALALGLTLAACGGGSTDSDAGDTASEQESASDQAGDDADMTSEGEMAGSGDFPVTVDTAAGEVTLEEQPQRIVSLSPSATEILFAIGAGDQVVAADSFSTYPEEAPTTDLSGYEPNVEAIAGYEPDLVVISGDTGDLTASLGELDIPVIDNPAPTTIEAGWDGMAALGLATGHVDETADTIADLRQQVDDAFAGFDGAEGLRVYHELDDTYFSPRAATASSATSTASSARSTSPTRPTPTAPATRSSPRRPSSRPTRSSSSSPTRCPTPPRTSRSAPAGPRSARCRTTTSSPSTPTSPPAGARACRSWCPPSPTP